MILVTGFPRSGTTLLYCMLRYAVQGYEFLERELPQLKEGCITKSPSGVFDLHPRNGNRCIVMLRDPRALLTSKHNGEKFRNCGYFLSAHSHLGSAKKGLCEWWTAIKKLSGALLVRYEDLITCPRDIQHDIGARFGLTYKPDHWFEDFHREPYGELFETAMNGRRPIQPRTTFDERRIREQFDAYPELNTVMQEMGYAI
jgi:hypothetical protein